jgi:ATP-dependent Clp protease ATP-binding subunit ClpA
MARLIQNVVKKPLAEKILFGELKEGGHVVVGARDGEIHLAVTAVEVAPPAPPEPVA